MPCEAMALTTSSCSTDHISCLVIMHSVYIDCQVIIMKVGYNMSVPLTCDLMEVAKSNANVGGPPPPFCRVVLVTVVAALHVNVEGAPPQSRRCKRGRWWRR